MAFKAIDVTPKKWTNIIVLYDDDKYSVCWGTYEGSLQRRIGVRWNNNYPRQGAHPTWYVEYDLFHLPYIEMLINIYKSKSSLSPIETSYLSNCEIAHKEAI